MTTPEDEQTTSAHAVPADAGVVRLTREEWIARCAAQYALRCSTGILNAGQAYEMAVATYDAWASEYPDAPEGQADVDMSYWDA